MNKKVNLKGMLAAALLLVNSASYAFPVKSDDGSVTGSIDSQVTAGFGYRLLNPSCNIIGNPTTNSTCSAGQVNPLFASGDNGDLNYNKGDFFSLNLKGTNEVVLAFPSDIKFMARISYLYDFVADKTGRTPLSSAAQSQVARDVRLLDLWVSKSFKLNGETARVRLGNQVINWGESLYGVGGISSTMALDYQKFVMPGTQIKEAILPAPMLSFATGIGGGLSFDSYYQFQWNKNLYSPVGSFWSNSDIFGRGAQPYYVTGDPAGCSASAAAAVLCPSGATAYGIGNDIKPKSSGQYGIALHYKPQGTTLDTGLYYLSYHDKSPSLLYNPNLASIGTSGLGGYQWKYLENRKLFGASVNFPLGEWAIGAELSYRPKDAVAISNYSIVDSAGNSQLWKEYQHYQAHLTAQLELTPGSYPTILNMLGGAQFAYTTTELVAIRFPGVTANGAYTPQTGYYATPAVSTTSSGYAALGTESSYGLTTDFNWTYDGTLIGGWQVTPGVTYFRALSGVTPTFTANYMSGAQNANFYLLFNQNPVKWQAGLNYTTFFGSNNAYNSPYIDRDFIGGFVTYNF